MSITPEELRAIANSAEPDPWEAATKFSEALLKAADHIERLTSASKNFADAAHKVIQGLIEINQMKSTRAAALNDLGRMDGEMLP